MITKRLQSGSGIAEFMVVAIPVILLALGGTELASWLNMRQIISTALVNAGRIASTQNARPTAIAEAFETSLHMAFPDQEHLSHRLHQNTIDIGLPWQIRILNPAAKVFNDHKNGSIHIPDQAKAVINNYYQDLQHQKNIQRGWLDGLGPQSQTDIFKANTLELELIWPQQPVLPGIKKIIRLLKPFFTNNRHIIESGYLPFVRYASISMQSHPGLWDNLPDGRVIYADNNQFRPDSNNLCTQQDWGYKCIAPNIYNQKNDSVAGTDANGQTPDSFKDSPLNDSNTNPNDESGMQSENNHGQEPGSTMDSDSCDLTY